MAIQLTGSQRQVVEDRGGRVLVSAAAGSGKTRVLVERLFRRVPIPGPPPRSCGSASPRSWAAAWRSSPAAAAFSGS